MSKATLLHNLESSVSALKVLFMPRAESRCQTKSRNHIYSLNKLSLSRTARTALCWALTQRSTRPTIPEESLWIGAKKDMQTEN